MRKKCPQFGRKKKSKRFAKNIQNPLLFNKGEKNMKIAIHYIYTIYVNIILLSTSKRLYMIHMNVFTAFLSRKYFLTAKKKMSPVWSIFSSKYSRNIIIVQCWSKKWSSLNKNPKNKKINLLRLLLSKNWNKEKHRSCPKIKELKKNIFQWRRKIKKKIEKVKNILK